MAESTRLASLPGYDTAADIYETPELAPAATAPTSPSTVPTSDEESELSSEDDRAGVSRRRLFPQTARSRFKSRSRGVEVAGVDLSDRVDGGRKGYSTRRRRRRRDEEGSGSGSEDVEEGLEAKIARLRREVEECRVLAEQERQDERAAPDPDGDTLDEQALGKVADFDTRLSALEQALGISTVDSVTSDTIAAPVLPSLMLLDQQLTALTAATSLSHLEAASSRIQRLRTEAEQPSTNGDTPETANQLPPEDAEKLQQLYALLPTLQSLSPTVPAMLARLRSLRNLHTTAASAAADLDEVEKRQSEMETDLSEWRNGLLRVEQAVGQASEANGKNGRIVDGWVKDLEARLANGR
ncbi:hypothetical protein LTR22_001509 [Elasticomyces elasticus]|nr:hypothetical protein LTR22_001509 [Elasticomyces elasticus]KAK4920813.1 hypothetical protein LTR49_011716 [Elasticomyces elasticus]KAK5767153.1 hypothetical protein LTS12_002611 [Elasticomyces elasticus]